MQGPDPSAERKRVVREVGRFTGFGLAWALSVLFFLLIGYWLDGKLGTLPWFTILGAFLGAAGGFVSLYRGITAAAADEEERRKGPRS
ncbi:MAG TPA: AtpZ/AtpI family protein [Gemmatimonadota bacterium]|nr:AtpZ/AtpI family protein [Gemmatimonadota bacterium]